MEKWKRAFASFFGVNEDDPIEEFHKSAKRCATLLSLPNDLELWDQAYSSTNHISLRAVTDEYERLILDKYGYG